MSIIKDTFFGGAEKKAAQAQEKALGESQEFIREGIREGRADINRLFPEAQQMQQAGFQGALDIFGQALPQQANVFQQGNVGAQQALLSGLPQMNQAILGGPIDYSALQPQTLDFDPSVFQQQLPTGIVGAIEQTQQAAQPQQPVTGGILGNLGGFGGLGGAGGNFGPWRGDSNVSFNNRDYYPSRLR